MRDVSQEEFESLIKDVIDEKTSRRKVEKELGTSMRTLNSRITKLSKTNPDLYKSFIKKFPYKPKEIKVDVENLAIRVILEGLQEVSSQTGISIKTIYRKVKGLEKTNPRLYFLYTHRNDNMSESAKIKFYQELEELQGDGNTDRTELQEKEEELRSVLSSFEELVNKGLSKAESARQLGYDGYPTIWKKYRELDRIMAEKVLKQDSAKNFRDKMKSKPSSEYNLQKMQEGERKSQIKREEGR